jgi:hypothetical protein
MLTDFVPLSDLISILAQGSSNFDTNQFDQELLGFNLIEQTLTRFGKNLLDLKLENFTLEREKVYPNS